MFGFSEIKNKIIPHRGTREGEVVDGTPPRSFWYGGDTAGGLWRHQQWSPSWILQKIRNMVKTVNMKNNT